MSVENVWQDRRVQKNLQSHTVALVCTEFRSEASPVRAARCVGDALGLPEVLHARHARDDAALAAQHREAPDHVRHALWREVRACGAFRRVWEGNINSITSSIHTCLGASKTICTRADVDLAQPHSARWSNASRVARRGEDFKVAETILSAEADAALIALVRPCAFRLP